MQARTRTAPASLDDVDAEPPVLAPGVVAVFSGRAIALPFAADVAIGREALGALAVQDDQMSREHFEVRQSSAGLAVADLASRNGTFLTGSRLERVTPVEPGDVLRAGRTLFVVVADTSVFVRAAPRIEADEVRGPEMSTLFARTNAMKRLEQLLILGESGTGKEHIARSFHEGRGPKAPFIALNCATLHGGIAERLLFGARKGVYTGAEADADGYIRAADGGTLFLDEIAELDSSVQAKLLRFLETREYFPLGDTKPRTATVRVCFATSKDLTNEVSARRFRDDLYHRISTPSVHVPPLRDRRAEIPHLVELQAHRLGGRVKPTIGFVENALRARWPGNVRQLLRAVEAALVAADAEGRAAVGAADLPLEHCRIEETTATSSENAEPSAEDIRLALEAADGNVSVAARALGVHRSKLRRWLQKNG